MQTASPLQAPRDWLGEIDPAARGLEKSGIVDVFDYGRNRQGLIPLGVGEGDLPTPAFVAEALKASLDRGETFYTYQAGIPALRSAISAYMTGIYGQPLPPERFYVTIGGMNALDIAARLTVGAGFEAIVPSPAWPNFAGALAANNARPVFVTLDPGERWSVDPAKLEAAITERTRAIFFNSPANPTGFVATREELVAVLDLARRRNLWIIADEIYGRLTYDGQRAPSFHDVMAPSDKILFVQTFSKNWAMTGLRIGWLEAPPELGPVIENLVQFTTSGVPVPIQRAAVAALEQGESFLAGQRARMTECRDILAGALATIGRTRFAMPQGAFYLFVAIDGEPDSRKLAFRLVDEAGVGVAPGVAFGPGGEGYVRICFARSPAEISEAARRLSTWLGRRP